jgi:hypothetical protein
VGSRIDPRQGGRPQRWLFAGVWLGVFLLITLLLVVAGIDWLATIAYARRQRIALAIEKRKALEPLVQKPTPPPNGKAY